MVESDHYLKQELYQRLRQDPDLFEWLEQGSLDGIWYWDLVESDNEWLSPKFKTCFGYREEEIPHTPEWWQANIFPEDLREVLDNFEKHAADASHPYDQIVRYRHKDGHTVWVRCRGLAIRDEHGKPIRMLGAHTDVTELMNTQVRLQEALSAQRRADWINKLALSSSQLGVWQWDMLDNSVTWDHTMAELHGISLVDFSGNYANWSRFVLTEDLPRVEQSIQQSVANNTRFDTTFRINKADGSIAHIHSTADLEYNEQNVPISMIGIYRDISKEVEREAQLQRSNEQLSAFSYAASHDLKAPLRNIRQLAGWVRQDLKNPPDAVEQNLLLMEQRIEKMESLLNELIGFYHTDHSNQELKNEDVRLDILCQDLFSFVNPPPSLRLHVGNLPTVRLCKTPFEQALRNLIDNAVKHRSSAEGNLFIWAETNASDVTVHIADDGHAIDQELEHNIKSLFEGGASKLNSPSSGIGLSMVKRLADNYSGSLSLTIKPATPWENLIQKQTNLKCFSLTWPLQNTP